MARWGRVLTAMVTPFDEDGALDVDGAVRLATWLVANGNDGLVLAGTTGESPVLTDDEKAELWRTVSEAVTVPVIAGSGTYDTRHSVHLTKLAEQCGAAGILAVTPYYNRLSQAGIESHFRALAEATSLPVMLYDIPIRTGRAIDHDVILRLARETSNIVAVKDAAAKPAASARLVGEAPPGFELYSGDDAQTLAFLAVGGVGIVSVAAHWCGTQMGEMVDAFTSGDVVRAAEINRTLLPSFAYEATDANPNPVPTKALLREVGMPAGHCRLPHVETDPEALAASARKIVDELGVVGAGSARGVAPPAGADLSQSELGVVGVGSARGVAPPAGADLSQSELGVVGAGSARGVAPPAGADLSQSDVGVEGA